MGTKRKERDEERPQRPEGSHGSTLFATSLPYTLTSVDLETLFSDYAPVRQAFVVLDKETKASKGVGYVSFAVKEDAEKVLEELGEKGVPLQGRTVRVQWPGEKPDPTATPAPPNAKKPRHAPTSKPRTSQADPNALRTVVISGLPDTVDSKVLWKKARKYPGAEKVVWPVLDAEEKVVPGVAHVMYDTAARAQSAVQALHAHTFKGALLSVVLKKRLDSSLKVPIGSTSSATPSKPITTDPTAADTAAADANADPSAVVPSEGPIASASAKGAPNRAGRLIVRNLPWHITSGDLRALFLPFGPIHSIEIPTSAAPAVDGEGQGKKRKPLAKGFAFVWFLSKGDAEKAMRGVNGKMVGRKEGKEGRKVAVDWALSKERWLEAAGGDGEAGEAEAVVGDEDEDEEGRTKVPGDETEEDDAQEKEEEEDDDDDNEIDDEEGEDHEVDDEEDDKEELDVEEDDEDGDDEPKGRPVLPQTDVGTTLFVRNIPFEGTDDDLRTTFRAFGPLRYARITLDGDSGRSRGTGFVCFWNKEDADRAIAAAELLAIEAGTAQPGPDAKSKARINPFALQSILTPDPASGLARNLVLHGRTLSVARAVKRDEAAKLKEDGEKRREKEDKRNLYLMREGVIFPNTPAASTVSSSELDRRVASFNARRTLLRSNPSLYISKTRLSVRQMPTFATDRTLKRLAIHAVRAFKAEARSGERPGLTADETNDDTAPSSGPGSKKKRGERQTPVVQAKIVRQAERVDPLSGKGKSKGYGFLEMRSHADALRVLRWANNNPDVILLMSGWWKDELAENLKKLDEQLKTEKDREKKEELNDRVRKTRQRIKGLEEGAEKGKVASEDREGKGLIMEFSIENVQVVKRRQELGEESRERASKRKVDSEAGQLPEEGRERSQKRRKLSGRPTGESTHDPTALPTGTPKVKKGRVGEDTAEPEKDKSMGKSIGAMIGRKRKQRKGQ